MNISIEKLREQDAHDVFAFESDNRLFFEKMVPGRSEAYFVYESYKQIHRSLLEEQTEGTSHFYLIRDESGTVVGRMNLVDVDHGSKAGYLGYRVGERFAGHGIATRALGLLLEEAVRLGVQHIHAKTTVNNVPSQRVLERNGFLQTTVAANGPELNGQRQDFVHYMWKMTPES